LTPISIVTFILMNLLHKYHFYIFLLLHLFWIPGAFAQYTEPATLSGLVLERGTSTRLADVNVTNLRNNRITRTSVYGVFTIEAAVGDSLSFSKVGYGPVKTVVQTAEDILIDMQAGLEIETIVVTRSTKEAELNSIMRDYEKKGIYNGGKNTFGTYLGSPATALYNLFGREAKNAKRFEKFMDQELEQTKVDRIFNRTIVSQLTKLEGQDLQDFIDYYRPSYSSAMSWGQYDLMKYINNSFDSWNANGRPRPQRLPKLDIPPQQK